MAVIEPTPLTASLLQQSRETATHSGFLSAWSRCVQEMRDARLAGQSAPVITLPQLYQLVLADSKLAQQFTTLPSEVLAR